MINWIQRKAEKQRLKENQKTVTERTVRLKENATFAEKCFRNKLNRMKIPFLFQKAFIKDYYAIVDFLIQRLKVCIEVDGEYHNTTEQQKKDKYRDGFLFKIHNLKTIRVSNNYAIHSTEQQIMELLGLKYNCPTCFHRLTKNCNEDYESGCTYWYSPGAKNNEQGIALQPWELSKTKKAKRNVQYQRILTANLGGATP